MEQLKITYNDGTQEIVETYVDVDAVRGISFKLGDGYVALSEDSNENSTRIKITRGNDSVWIQKKKEVKPVKPVEPVIPVVPEEEKRILIGDKTNPVPKEGMYRIEVEDIFISPDASYKVGTAGPVFLTPRSNVTTEIFSDLAIELSLSGSSYIANIFIGGNDIARIKNGGKFKKTSDCVKLLLNHTYLIPEA